MPRMLAAEAAKTAPPSHGCVSGHQPRARCVIGMEALEDHPKRRWAALACPTLALPSKCPCGRTMAATVLSVCTQWDCNGQDMTLISDFAETDKELLDGADRRDSEGLCGENNIEPAAS